MRGVFVAFDPKEMAQRCRDEADICDDPRTVAFLRELADDYDALAEQGEKDGPGGE